MASTSFQETSQVLFQCGPEPRLTRGNTQEGTTQRATTSSPSCSPCLAVKGATAHSPPSMGWRGSRLRWCLPMEGRGRATHSGTQLCLSSCRAQNLWQVGLTPPLCAQKLRAMQGSRQYPPMCQGHEAWSHPGRAHLCWVFPHRPAVSNNTPAGLLKIQGGNVAKSRTLKPQEMKRRGKMEKVGANLCASHKCYVAANLI